MAIAVLPMLAPRQLVPIPLASSQTPDDVTQSGAIEHPLFSAALASRPAQTVIADTDTTIDAIAAAHRVDAGALRWANTLREGAQPAAGDPLLVPPGPSALVPVDGNERPSHFASRLGLDPRTVLDYNSLATDSPLPAGRYLQVPLTAAPPNSLLPSEVVPTADGIPEVSSRQASHGYNGFPFGQCTWYVATRRNVTWNGDAGTWWYRARGSRPEGRVPVKGAIVVMENAPVGHTAYVEQVNRDGSFVISEMNYFGAPGGGWGRVDRRTIRMGTNQIAGFIY